jgi:hypothetical protein
MELPMLDEDEYRIAHELYGKGFKNPVRNIEVRFKELLDYYHKITGLVETNPNGLMHHRIALYGPPCERCGTPYRTPKATFCVACGNKRV